jgi:chromosome partitioning protein
MADTGTLIHMALSDLRPRAPVYGFGIQKGGEGKSTTTHHVARLLAGCYGVRTLVLDCAQPGTTTAALTGVGGQELATGLPELIIRMAMAIGEGTPGPADLDPLARAALAGSGDPQFALPLTIAERLALLPYRPNLARAIRAVDTPDVLLRVLRPLLPQYDLVLIDYPPDLTQLMANCLFATDVVITPLRPTAESLEGAEEFFGALARASQLREAVMGIPTRLGGILITQVDARSRQWRDAVRTLRLATSVNGLDITSKLLPFAIKRSAAYPQAYQNGVPVWQRGGAYTPPANPDVWAGYVALTEWILRDARMVRFIAQKTGVARLVKPAAVLNPWDMALEELASIAGEGGEG